MTRSPTRRTEADQDPWVVVARIVRSRGNRGEVLAEIETDFPEERLRPGPVHLRDAEGRVREAEMVDVWFHKDRVVLKLDGIDTISDAETLRRHEWVVPEDEMLPLPEGTFYRHQLVGLEVRDPAGAVLGVVDAIQPSPGGDLLVLELEGREVLVPSARRYVQEVDLEAGVLVLDLPDDLRDLNP